MISSVQPTIQRRNDDIQVDTIANEYQAAKCTCDHSFETLRIRGGTADPDVINENGSTSRSTRKRQVSIAHESGMMDERLRTRRKPTSTDNEMLWICEECREAECTEDPDAVLMICDGSCKRAFHNHCCGINANAAESEDLWVCSDCMNKKHRCALCQEYGTDDEDVFLCDKKGCGMFFHESCLRMQNIDVRLVAIDNASAEQKEITPTNDDESDAKTRPVFICPAHSCWTCTEDYIPEDGEENGKGKSTKNRGKRRKQANSKGNFLSKKDGLLFVSASKIQNYAVGNSKLAFSLFVMLFSDAWNVRLHTMPRAFLHHVAFMNSPCYVTIIHRVTSFQSSTWQLLCNVGSKLK